MINEIDKNLEYSNYYDYMTEDEDFLDETSVDDSKTVEMNLKGPDAKKMQLLQ